MYHTKQFSRFIALMQAVMAAGGLGTPTGQSLAASYRSRGHGKAQGLGAKSTAQHGKTYRPCTDWSHATGQREALRHYRRAQGGPGLRLIDGSTWVART